MQVILSVDWRATQDTPLIVPELAVKGDRSIVFPGHIHSAFTPLAAELQALLGFAFLNGWIEVPGQEEMEL